MAGQAEHCFFYKAARREEKEAFMLWAIDGITPTEYAHLLPQSIDASRPHVHNATAAPVRPQNVPLQKELLVNTKTDDAPKTPAMSDWDDPQLPVQPIRT